MQSFRKANGQSPNRCRSVVHQKGRFLQFCCGKSPPPNTGASSPVCQTEENLEFHLAQKQDTHVIEYCDSCTKLANQQHTSCCHLPTFPSSCCFVRQRCFLTEELQPNTVQNWFQGSSPESTGREAKQWEEAKTSSKTRRDPQGICLHSPTFHDPLKLSHFATTEKGMLCILPFREITW